MSVLKVADFYYGAFLSALLNYGKKKPSLFDRAANKDSRRIYCLTTENSTEDYIIFTKAVMAQDNKTEKFEHWIFNFDKDEIKTLIDLHKGYGNVKLALICIKPGLTDSELALLDYENAMDCLGVNIGVKSRTINIKYLKKSKKGEGAMGQGKIGLRAFGSGRDEKIDGRDNTIRIPRDALKKL